MACVLRAAFGYCFLVFMIRIVGRRPGKQMTPYEFVLIFFIGGLTLTSMVAVDRSLTNAFVQIVTVAILHYVIAWLRQRSPRFGVLVDGTPMILLQNNEWEVENLGGLRIADDDVMAAARDQGLSRLDQIKYAVLERNGEISIIPIDS